jgi:hypothetical protein
MRSESNPLLLYADCQADEGNLPLLDILPSAPFNSVQRQFTLLAPQAATDSPVRVVSTQTWTPAQTIAWLQQQSFAAALIFTNPGRSPYSRAYLCYLAGITIRLGASCEFGGGVLSHCFPAPETASIADSYRYLLHSSLEYLCGYEF